ncbi:hypothetical protein L1987_84382 [Smallanthus sonchifolius]|uniref:Uncharacterized protein n=1 Tax=Smallanthus sonchifolius TaxID=185202 RepID=A0ACB8YDX8_9ASTR|nr:hypothetical protein L1987_84382 [Smallanthus sonchifolius]
MMSLILISLNSTLNWIEYGNYFKRVVDGDGDDDEDLPPGIRVLEFDYSVENYFKVVDKIAMLYGESELEYEQIEIQRLSSSVTFLSKWRDFCYQPRTIRFACEKETSQEKDVTTQINLPQFSSAAVPKDISLGNETSSPLSKDFVMYVGGPIWALDWCPRVHPTSAFDTNVEFIAVSAHPPESSYHKIGAPLTGRGLVQIWCILNTGQSQQIEIPLVKVKRKSFTNIDPTKPKKPRGRPRKTPRIEMDDSDQLMQDLPVQSPESSNNPRTLMKKAQKPRGRPRKNPMKESSNNFDLNRQLLTEFTNDSPKTSPEPLAVALQLVSKEQIDKKVNFHKPQKPRGIPGKKPMKESSNSFDLNGESLTEFTNDSPRTSQEPLAVALLTEFTKKKDGSDQLMQDLPVQSPESSNNLLQLVSKEEIVKKDNSHKPQTPRGRPKKKPMKESSNNFDLNRESRTEFTNDSPRTSPEPLAVAFPDESTKLFAKDKFTLYTREILAKEQVTKKISKVYTRMPSNYNKDHSSKSMQTASKSKLTKCQTRKESKVKGADSPILSQNCESPLDQDDVLPGFVMGLAHNGYYNKDHSEKSLSKPSKPKVTKSQVKGADSPILSQSCESPLDQDDALPRLVMGLAHNGYYTEDHSANSLSKTSKSKVIKLETRRKSQVKGADSPILSQNCESPLDQDEVLPRLVMGLAHNGKVAWDVKWRPSDSHSVSKHIMGYLAILLGNGALEVWEVPLPHVTKAIFSSCQKEGNDPRFLKLKPVFLCSMLKCGDRQSIPLTLEWSASAPHDLILAGCHDGVVALWKFSASSSSKDTRPLLCFSADTVPIRALKWAPLASDPESANTIVTAGHKGLKFWDIRDPFHPLWDISSQKIINSLDWLPDPRCVVLSCDDGEIKIISLLKAANDVPVTGMPSDKKPQHGSYSYYCSSSSIWSVQVSRLTGMVAYSCSDGKVINFQLTIKAVEKDPLRNRVPHYLCGSLTEEDSSLTVLSPLPYIPIPMKKSSTEYGDTPKSSRGVKSRLNQEKRANDQISKCQTPPKQSSEGVKAITQKNNNDPSGETQTQTSRALVCIDNDDKVEEENVIGEDVKEEVLKVTHNKKTEVFPPKSVAMHRATWNMNKGSERFVCYGGAAGIVRCQEIKKFAT